VITSDINKEDYIKAAKAAREMRKLDMSWNPTGEIATVIEADKEGLANAKELHFVFNIELHSDNDAPANYKAAMQGPEREQWALSMKSEILNFVKRNSCKSVKREEVKSSGRTIMETKWVYKKKDEQEESVQYKSRCVSKGFQQRLGVDYTESLSPVASDTLVRAVIAMTLYMSNRTIEVINIEAAFLECTLEEPAYIEWPDGMLEFGFITKEQAQTTIAQLLKSMYGNVNAALRFFKADVKHLTSIQMEMHQNLADPCVFVKKHEGETVPIALTHVDDTIICREKKWIEWYKENVATRVNYSDLGKLKHISESGTNGQRMKTEMQLFLQQCQKWSEK
jgi:hypothetical protein